MFEEMGHRVDQPDFIVKTINKIRPGALCNIFGICLGDTHGYFAFLGDHSVGAQSAVAGEVVHVGGFCQNQCIKIILSHQIRASGNTFFMYSHLPPPLCSIHSIRDFPFGFTLPHFCPDDANHAYLNAGLKSIREIRVEELNAAQ
jgi:hypothetical protein